MLTLRHLTPLALGLAALLSGCKSLNTDLGKNVYERELEDTFADAPAGVVGTTPSTRLTVFREHSFVSEPRPEGEILSPQPGDQPAGFVARTPESSQGVRFLKEATWRLAEARANSIEGMLAASAAGMSEEAIAAYFPNRDDWSALYLQTLSMSKETVLAEFEAGRHAEDAHSRVRTAELENERVRAELQLEGQRLQAEAELQRDQLDAQRALAELQADLRRAELEYGLEGERLQVEAELREEELETKVALEALRMELERAELDFELAMREAELSEGWAMDHSEWSSYEHDGTWYEVHDGAWSEVEWSEDACSAEAMEWELEDCGGDGIDSCGSLEWVEIEGTPDVDWATLGDIGYVSFEDVTWESDASCDVDMACDTASACDTGEACDDAADCCGTCEGEADCSAKAGCDTASDCDTGAACDAMADCGPSACAAPAAMACETSKACDTASDCDTASACDTGEACDAAADCCGTCEGEADCSAKADCSPKAGCDTASDCDTGEACDAEAACDSKGDCGAPSDCAPAPCEEASCEALVRDSAACETVGLTIMAAPEGADRILWEPRSSQGLTLSPATEGSLEVVAYAPLAELPLLQPTLAPVAPQDRFGETAVMFPAGAAWKVQFEHKGLAGETVELVVTCLDERDTKGGPDKLEARYSLTLNKKGKGKLKASLPEGWRLVRLDGPDAKPLYAVRL